MTTRKNLYILIGVSLLVLLTAAGWFFTKNAPTTEEQALGVAPTEDPLDVTLDFYNSWHAALQSTTTDPYQSGLLTSAVLSETARAQIETRRTDQSAEKLEPVLCQPTTPKRIGGKAIYTKETEAQIMILARGEEVKTSRIAMVTLKAVAGDWQITDISCTNGEVGPDKEFDFEHTGFLLKQSVPAPLNKENWHLVFEQDGQTGYTIPLFFDAESMCTSTTGESVICNTSTFAEAMKVLIQADVTEEGAYVTNARFE